VSQSPATATKVQIWSALAIVYVVWGSTYVAIKLAVRTLPPLLAGGTRFLVAATILGVVLLLSGRSLRISRREALGATVIGTMLLAIGVGFVHVAERRIDSSVAAMIAGSVPLQIIVWRSLAGDRVKRGTIGAALVGIVGLALIVVPGGLDGGSTATGLAIMLMATMSWSSGSFISQKLALPKDAFVATFYEMLAGGLVLTAVASALGQWHDVTRDALQPGPVAAWFYLAVAGSVVGFTAYAWLLDKAPISQVVTHQYVNPLVAVVLGAALLGERPNGLTAVGAVLIVGAVIVTVRRESGNSSVSTLERGTDAPPGTRVDPIV
jgi:drug/metabolite transporter (DMT)-like permease